MEENCREETCENVSSERDVVKEIENYGNTRKLAVINRDGDKYYAECPSCHSTDLNGQRLLSCKSCHTHFQAYYEDGFHFMNVDTDHGSISSSSGEVKVIELEPDAYFKKILHGRNDYPEHIDKLRVKYPDMKILKIARDLGKDGKDAHGHAKYKRFALIPLD